MSAKTSNALKVELGKLVLHYPIKRLTEEQFGVWATGYHQVLADYPDELLQEVCLDWLGTVGDRMPTPADLKQRCERTHALRKIYVEYAGAAAGALRAWDEDHSKQKAPQHG